MGKVKWQLGQVIWFDEFSGEGEIRSENGQDFFVHYSAIDSNQKWKTLKSRQQVKFQSTEDPKRKHIAKVRNF